jgi:hypothetical protein
LDEEDGDVVANNVPIAFFGVELDGESSNIANGVCRPTATKHGRESQEDGSCAGRVCEHTGGGDIGGRFEERELAESSRATSVYDALGDALVVEAVDLQRSVRGRGRTEWDGDYLLATKLIFQQHGAIFVLSRRTQPVVGVGLLDAKVARDPVVLVVHILGVGGHGRHLCVLYASHAFGLFGHGREELGGLGGHVGILKYDWSISICSSVGGASSFVRLCPNSGVVAAAAWLLFYDVIFTR